MASLFSFRPRDRRSNDRRRTSTRPELQLLEPRSLLSGYTQLNLVGYQPGMARRTDPNLNGWGLDFAPNGPFCVADTSTGVATFYDRQGRTVLPPVTIPAAPVDPPGTPGSPTGVVYNPTSDFVISENGKSAPAVFLFDTLDGLICGWSPKVDATHAIVVIDNSAEAPFAASYTGLTMAPDGQGREVLYAADSGDGPTISNNRIDMVDGQFHSIGSFTDPSVAAQFPGNTVFQVESVDNKLFVTFTGFTEPFGGVVDIFDTDGNLLTPNHFAANSPDQGPLNAPWGVALAPSHFGAFSHDLLIGNVEGAGNINAFDPATGAFLGALTHPDGTPIAIAGLWDLAFGGGGETGRTDEMFFTAGFNADNPAGNGLFGVIRAAGDQGDGRGVGGDGADAMAARGPIAGPAPPAPASATGPGVVAYGWLVDIGPTSSGVATTVVHQARRHTIDWNPRTRGVILASQPWGRSRHAGPEPA